MAEEKVGLITSFVFSRNPTYLMATTCADQYFDSSTAPQSHSTSPHKDARDSTCLPTSSTDPSDSPLL